MKMCFYARAGQLKFYVALAKRLLMDGIEVCFVTQHRSETKWVKRQLPNARVHEVERFLAENWNRPGADQWDDIAATYAHLNLWRMVYADRFLVKYERKDAVRMARLHFDFFEMVFACERPDFFVNEAVAILSAYVAYEVGVARGVKYVGTMIARDDARGHFFFVEEPYQGNAALDRLYDGGIFTEAELSEALDYLREFRNRPAVPAYMEVHRRRPKLHIRMLLQLGVFLVVRSLPMYRDPIRYMSFRRENERVSPLLRLVNYRRYRSAYRKPVAREKFYLFPLHFQPEASTLVCAPKYEKQLIAIDHLAKSLPSDSVLYVKEHYAAVGHREPSFYAALASYPNVRLIDPYVDVHELIRSSVAVVVLTSTTGFEAILHGKKVFVLGNVFYDRFENVRRVADVFDEACSLSDYVPVVGDERIIRFVAAYRKSLVRGCVSPAFPEFLSKSNVDSVAKGLLRFAEGFRSRSAEGH